MASSYSYYKEDVKEYLENRFKSDISVLDVGAGSGTYYNLVGDYFSKMDAVEVFRPNIEKYRLEDKYRKVYCIDIKDFVYEQDYDLIIFGDIIEHLTVEEAQKVLKEAKKHCREMLVAVPYRYVQGVEEENVYEIHKQDDLTPKNVLERYPYLKLLYGNDKYGYYILQD